MQSLSVNGHWYTYFNVGARGELMLELGQHSSQEGVEHWKFGKYPNLDLWVWTYF